MNNMLAKQRQSVNKEDGYNLVELMIAILATTILTLVLTPIIIGFTQSGTALANKQMGINQGVVADKAVELGMAGTKFRQQNPTTPLTKEALLQANPELVVPESYTWAVGTFGRENHEVCAVVYSTTDQAQRYTQQNPAEWNTAYKLGGTHSTGCWYMKSGKGSQPNYNEVDPNYNISTVQAVAK